MGLPGVPVTNELERFIGLAGVQGMRSSITHASTMLKAQTKQCSALPTSRMSLG